MPNKKRRSPDRSSLSAWVPLSLIAAWLVNDAEEWLTMSATSREVMRRVPSWVPLSEAMRRGGISDAEVRRSIPIMGAAFLVASIAGAVTGGRSALFRGAALSFGLHGYTHVASAFLMRVYTSGVITGATVVIPWGHWVRRRLREVGLPIADKAALRVAGVGIGVLLAAHGLAIATLGDKAFGPPDNAPVNWRLAAIRRSSQT